MQKWQIKTTKKTIKGKYHINFLLMGRTNYNHQQEWGKWKDYFNADIYSKPIEKTISRFSQEQGFF
jgi:hypothetical protein